MAWCLQRAAQKPAHRPTSAHDMYSMNVQFCVFEIARNVCTLYY